jgi:hypothetical protein
MHYHFCRVHQTLRVTHTKEAGIGEHIWPLEELVAPLTRVPSNQLHESNAPFLPICLRLRNNLVWLRSVRRAAIFRRIHHHGGIDINNLASGFCSTRWRKPN